MDLYETNGWKLSSSSIVHKNKTLDKILDKSLMDAYFEEAPVILGNNTVKINLTHTRINAGDAFSLSNGDIKVSRKCKAHMYGATALQIQAAGASCSNLMVYVNDTIARTFAATSGEEIYSASSIPIDCILDLNVGDSISIYVRPRKMVAPIGNEMTSVILKEL